MTLLARRRKWGVWLWYDLGLLVGCLLPSVSLSSLVRSMTSCSSLVSVSSHNPSLVSVSSNTPSLVSTSSKNPSLVSTSSNATPKNTLFSSILSFFSLAVMLRLNVRTLHFLGPISMPHSVPQRLTLSISCCNSLFVLEKRHRSSAYSKQCTEGSHA